MTEALEGGTVTIPIAPPRDPGQYTATDHFRNRLRERVDDHRRDTLPATLIREGRVRRAPATADDVPEHERGAMVAFTTATATGRPWTLLAALRPRAFADPDAERHRAVTIYQGPAPDVDAATARGVIMNRSGANLYRRVNHTPLEGGGGYPSPPSWVGGSTPHNRYFARAGNTPPLSGGSE